MVGAVARIAALERADRRTKRLFRSVWLIAGLAVLSGQDVAPGAATSDTLLVGASAGRHVLVSANGVSLFDASGRQRMYFGLDDRGQPLLESEDAASIPRQAFGLFTDGNPYVRFFDQAKVRRFDLSLTQGDHPSVEIDDAQGVDRADLFESSTGDPNIELRGPDGKARFYLANGSQGAFVGYQDSAGVIRLFAGLYVDQGSGVVVFDADHVALWRKP